jgi:RNA polymerase sigma factor (sigma-70 family)
LGFGRFVSMRESMSSLAQPGAPSAPPAAASGAPADEELVRRVRAGDERAFEAIYERYRLPLHRYCHSIVRQREDAEEAFQATMLGAFRSLTSGEAREIALRPWLYRIAHNECVTALRRRGRRETGELSGLEVAPDDVAQQTELAAELRQLKADLAQLSESQRSALVMRELGGLGHAEIARALGRDADAVKQLIYEARMSLHTLAEGRELACEAVRRTLSDGDGRAMRGRALRAHLRACAGCRDFQAGLVRRPARLAMIAPVLPAVLFREVLAKAAGMAGGSGAAAAGASGLAAAGAGGGAVLGGGATATGVAGGLGAKLAAIGSAALIGGTAAGVPAIDSAVHGSAAPTTTPIAALVRAEAPTAPAAAAPAGPGRFATPLAAGARGARASVAARASRTPGARGAVAKTLAAPARGLAAAAAVPGLGRAAARAAVPARPPAAAARPGSRPAGSAAPPGPIAPAPDRRAGATTPESRATSAPAVPAAAAGAPRPALAPPSEPRAARPAAAATPAPAEPPPAPAPETAGAPALPAGGPDAPAERAGDTRRR